VRIIILTFLLLIAAQQSWACYVRPAEHVVPPDELIERTDNILLGKVVKAEKSGEYYYYKTGEKVIYTFEVLTELKGNMLLNDNKFTMTGLEDGDDLRNYNHHKDEEFWDDWGGRMFHEPNDCKIYPTFVVGENYLIFYNKPWHAKSFELIKNPPPVDEVPDPITTDKWLIYVLENLTNSNSADWQNKAAKQ